ncbi:MAG TPA: SpoIID/LytB domain-containing protein [Tepidisphaeraceae bacterium]|nr:SpoIID/LytB domain-containing protein [Tepidisphaeraceae bacterium]
MRVCILSNQEQVVVAASSAPLMKSANETQSRRIGFPAGAAIPVTLSPAGWRIGNVTFAGGELIVQPEPIGSISINGSSHRGRYRLVPVAANRFDVVNDVDIDSYLMGVVAREMLRDWNEEAYKAQAIVARTYALYEAKTTGGGRPFDLYDDERSQVYGGISAESTKSREAVSETAGVVVAYGPPGEERIFKAYFSSCCGGVGQSAYDAFGDPDIPPLREKSVGALCSASTKFNWGPIVLRKDELTRRIKSWGAKRGRPEKEMGELMRIDIAAVNHYQRPVRFLLTDSRGLQYSLSGEELRWACNSDANGGAILNSSFVRPISEGDTIQFVEGHGWGHGVGMCQWCAEALAERGTAHEDIVRFSYPGAVLVRAY